MSGSPFSDIEDVRVWARGKMQFSPDFVIGENYLRRWWIVPRNKGCNVYLHEILHSDDDRALHDHPWENTSYLIDGSYIEVTPDGEFLREAGSIVHRQATDAHRLVIPEGGRAVSIFMTGPVIREWGFHCPQGWKHWRDFVDGRDTGQVGAGCGETNTEAVERVKAREYECFIEDHEPKPWSPGRCAGYAGRGSVGMHLFRCKRRDGHGLGGLFCKQHAKNGGL